MKKLSSSVMIFVTSLRFICLVFNNVSHGLLLRCENKTGSSSSSSSSRAGWTYDVFLSFRGEDTRKNFTDHLYTALVQAGIYTFRDDNELPRGEEISSQLLKAIQESKISIVVFSQGYASSTWCLDELARIMECRSTNGQIVFPVFYDIDPSNVRKQKRSFAEAFETHEERFKEEIEKVNKWRKALVEAANLSGWDLKNMANGHESKFINKIVEAVLDKLDRKYLNVAKHPIGIDSRVNNVISLLRIDANDVRVVGIYGMAGIGKTTMAKAIFNQLFYGFEGCCFLFNVKDISKQHNGPVQLQEQLLCDVLKPNIWKINNIHRGINLIKERLCHKRVLVVVDDVDHLEQLDALVGERSWFGLGSRIIVTTRDERLLTQIEVDEKYQAIELDYDDSLQLFSWHAFKCSYPIEDYLDLSNGVVGYSGGLPLALEVLGSYLFKRSKAEWESAIDKLRKIPHNQIQKKLRISFDTLDDDTVKGIFLDVACFFIGWDKDYVAKILDGRGFFPEIGITILIERSLLSINDRNEVHMHDLLRDMGREIIREMSPDNPGKRNRIWCQEDVLDVLNKQKGTEVVEGLVLDVRASKVLPLMTESFIKIANLKLLQINGVQLWGCYKFLSKVLIWLCWYECPLKFLPSDLQLGNIVVLDMQNSNIRELWKETKFLNKLKILNLSNSKYLAKTPNFHSSSLEKLILSGCSNLVELHQSIGHLKSLVLLNLEGCSKLNSLPPVVCDLKSLQTLNITMCLQLEKLPESLGDMESLTELLANGTAIQQLPSSIGRLKNLRNLSLRGCSYENDSPSTSWLALFSSWLSPKSCSSKALLPASFAGLTSLRELDLSYRGLSEDSTSTSLGSLHSLKELNLSGNKFLNLPTGVGCLSKLEQFFVVDCKNLISISELPSSLKFLHACDCTSMERLSIKYKEIPALSLSGCQKLIEIEGMDGGRAMASWPILLDDCNNLADNFKKRLVQALTKGEHCDICFPGSEIPDWFSSHGDGSSLSFHAPAVLDGQLEALVVWVVFAANKIRLPYPSVSAFIEKESNGVQLIGRSKFLPFSKISTDHSWVNHIPITELPHALEGGEGLKLSVNASINVNVKKCGVHMIVKKPDMRNSQGILIPFTSPYPHEKDTSSKQSERLQMFGMRLGKIMYTMRLQRWNKF